MGLLMNLLHLNTSEEFLPSNYPGEMFSEKFRELAYDHMNLVVPVKGELNAAEADYAKKMIKYRSIYKKKESIRKEFIIEIIKTQQNYIKEGFIFESIDSYYWRSTISANAYGTQDIFNSESEFCGINPIKISFDYDKKTISLGNLTIRYPRVSYKKGEILHLVRQAIDENGFSLPDFYTYPAVNNFVRCALFGKNIESYLRKLSYFIWVSEYESYIKKYCRDSAGALSDRLIIKFHKNIESIKFAIENGEDHMIPAILFFGKSLGKIKKTVGPYCWKKLLKNAPSKNTAIFSAMSYLCPFFLEDGDINSKTETLESLCDNKSFGVVLKIEGPVIYSPNLHAAKTLLLALVDINSSIIRKRWSFSYFGERATADKSIKRLELTKWLSREAPARKVCSSTQGVMDLVTLFDDTKNMAFELERPFFCNWSYRHMKKRHDDYTREYEEKFFFPFDFKFKRAWPDIINPKDTGIVARLLKTSTELRREGKEMKHCVGSYVKTVAFGASIIYSLKHMATGVRSTLEISINPQTLKMSVKQHKGYLNYPLPPSVKAYFDSAENLILGIVKKCEKIEYKNEEWRDYIKMVENVRVDYF